MYKYLSIEENIPAPLTDCHNAAPACLPEQDNKCAEKKNYQTFIVLASVTAQTPSADVARFIQTEAEAWK